MEKVHIPYWLPSGFVIIWVVPPFCPQKTDAGFAMPVPVVFVAAGVGAGVCTWVACWVQPARNMPVARQIPTRIIKPVLDII